MTETLTDVTRSLTTPPPPPSLWARTRRWAVETPLIQVAILIVLSVALVLLVPAFVQRPLAAVSLITLAALLAMAAMGQTLVVILGGLDLAIAGYITFGAMIAGNATSRLGWPVPLAFAVVFVVCGGIGALVGWLCHRFRVEPLVMTLGVGAVLTGGSMFIANGDYNGQPPQELKSLAQLTGTTFGLPIPPIIVIVVLLGVLLWLFLAKTPAGRRLYATGVNPRAAGLTRIRTSVVWTLVFAASGVFAGVAGMFLAAFGSGWSMSIGDPYLFSGLAAVLVGGTTFGSVRGGFTRTALGALILTVLSTIIVSQGLTEGQTRIVYGVIILVMVALYGRERRVRDRF
ncbi:ABC transporter permease [Pseudoclavibacter chungangensis]|uniref:Autoinducer 2 import system permease protein LsrD n=1 Tax=Pseudoclavibacter chungangensis TaxID=587635 RepID=A0A7J5BN02_9MICO|nr:ABC transporter permease [Pseudoclavibacter chungangensis]KAB1652847.1 ABC transporter permease [Pseudoclavibacter chungangensis]NYJ67157.1 ribose transport system permease protein [Pseudoclavibacter chungangensis]